MERKITPGFEGEDVFKSQEEYEEFNRNFWNAIKDDIRKSDFARARSWEKLRFKIYV